MPAAASSADAGGGGGGGGRSRFGAPVAPLTMPNIPSVLPGPPPGMPPAVLPGGLMGLPAGMTLPSMPMVAPPSQQATRHARRCYVGGLPPTATDQSVSTFFSTALAAIGGNTAGAGNSVVNVYINKEKNFAFVEFRTVEETSNAMALDSIMFEGASLRVRRPNDYNAMAAATLGPSLPNPALNLEAIGLGAKAASAGSAMTTAATGAPGAPRVDPHYGDRIFVGGLPYYLTEDNCKELLGSFGAIQSFDLVKDKETGECSERQQQRQQLAAAPTCAALCSSTAHARTAAPLPFLQTCPSRAGRHDLRSRLPACLRCAHAHPLLNDTPAAQATARATALWCTRTPP